MATKISGGAISLPKGQQPDGDYVTASADGSAFATSSNLGGTRLNGAINDSVTTLTVDSTADFPSTGTLHVGNEIITYTGKTSTTFTGCTRGALQSTAAAQVDDADVGECYVSSWYDTDGWNTIEFFVKSDVISAFQGIHVQFTDDTQAATPTVRAEDTYTYTTDDVNRGYQDIRVGTVLDGFRFIYANGNTTTTDLFIDALLLVDADRNRYNKGGGLITTEFDVDAALGLVSNYEISTKFGRVKAIDAVDNAVDVWAFADDTLATRSDTKTFPTSASVCYLASSSASDTAVDVQVFYLDAAGVARDTTVTLTGQTGVSLGFAALDVNRMRVVSSTAAVGDIYITTANNYSAGGLPNDVTQVLAYIPAGYGQTQQTQLTVPKNKRLIIKAYDIFMSRASGAAGSGTLTLRVKPNGLAPRILRESFPTTTAPTQKPRANIVIEELSQIVWRLDDVSDNDTNVSVNWDYELIDD